MSSLALELPVLLPQGPDCRNCQSRLEADLQQVKGVSEAAVDPTAGTLHVAFDPDVLTLSRVEEEARRIGATISSGIDHQTLDLKELDCPDCAASIEKAVRRVPGVLWAAANFPAAQMHVEFARDRTNLPVICRVVEGHGVRACPVGVTKGEQRAGNESGGLLRVFADNRRAVLLALTAALMGLAAIGPAAWRIPLLGAAIVAGGWTTARSAIAAARARSLDMNVLMTLAVIGAAGIGDWFEAASVVVLFNLGNLLQAGAMERTRRSIRRLITAAPRTAMVHRDGAMVSIDAELVRPGEVIAVKPGERIPLDGEVIAGATSVDESPITGESVPREKSVGDLVFAGALNGRGAIDVRVTRAYADTTLARIIHRVEEAQVQRAPIQQTIDRFAHIYTPAVLALAVCVAILPPIFLTSASQLPAAAVDALRAAWFLRGLSLLIISCPCALVISTPVAVVRAIGLASRRGALIKGGAYLEEMGRIRAMVYDKSGTLSKGEFRIDDTVPLADLDVDRLRDIAAAIESRSEHPLARAFATGYCGSCCGASPVTAFEALSGLGARATVEGTDYLIGSARLLALQGIDVDSIHYQIDAAERAGYTVVLLADSDQPLGMFLLADEIRDSAAATVASLRAAGIEHQAMLTGDSEAVGGRISAAASLDEFRAGLLPEDKQAEIRALKSRFGSVAMVGDGMNDAPALATSNVGIVMGAAGSDVTIETADVALMSDDLSNLPYIVRLSRRTRGVIRQNIAFSLATKLALIGTAVTVGVPLWLAVAGDVGVSLIVTANALRLRG